MKSLIFLFLGFSAVVLTSAENRKWSYGNYTNWSGYCQTGKSQSPVDFNPNEAIYHTFSTFNFLNYDKPFSATVKNNGHSIAITLTPNNRTLPSVQGGGLRTVHLLHHIHFHWQSEHTIDGYRFPLEMHLVHHSARFASLQDAINGNGLAVFGVLFETSLDNDDYFEPLLEATTKITGNPSMEVPLEKAIVPRMFLPRNTGNYLRYIGSLTTPGCDEEVVWTVFLDFLPLSTHQIALFEDTWSEHGPLTLNFRSTQPLNGRIVYIRQSKHNGRATGDAALTRFSISLLLLCLIMV